MNVCSVKQENIDRSSLTYWDIVEQSYAGKNHAATMNIREKRAEQDSVQAMRSLMVGLTKIEFNSYDSRANSYDYTVIVDVRSS